MRTSPPWVELKGHVSSDGLHVGAYTWCVWLFVSFKLYVMCSVASAGQTWFNYWRSLGTSIIYCVDYRTSLFPLSILTFFICLINISIFESCWKVKWIRNQRGRLKWKLVRVHTCCILMWVVDLCCVIFSVHHCAYSFRRRLHWNYVSVRLILLHWIELLSVAFCIWKDTVRINIIFIIFLTYKNAILFFSFQYCFSSTTNDENKKIDKSILCFCFLTNHKYNF